MDESEEREGKGLLDWVDAGRNGTRKKTAKSSA